jgi:hypothetical protein
MNAVAVESSVLRYVKYHEESMTLEIGFVHNGRYEYYNVPREVHAQLMDPPGGSHGSFYNAQIRNVYPYKKLD